MRAQLVRTMHEDLDKAAALPAAARRTCRVAARTLAAAAARGGVALGAGAVRGVRGLVSAVEARVAALEDDTDEMPAALALCGEGRVGGSLWRIRCLTAKAQELDAAL